MGGDASKAEDALDCACDSGRDRGDDIDSLGASGVFTEQALKNKAQQHIIAINFRFIVHLEISVGRGLCPAGQPPIFLLGYLSLCIFLLHIIITRRRLQCHLYHHKIKRSHFGVMTNKTQLWYDNHKAVMIPLWYHDRKRISKWGFYIKKRILFFAVALSLIFSAIGMMTQAEESPSGTADILECHLAHDSDCGYSEAVTDSPCIHSSEACSGPARMVGAAPFAVDDTFVDSGITYKILSEPGSGSGTVQLRRQHNAAAPSRRAYI